MKQSEFRQWLAAQGATFKEGANHTKVYLNGQQTIIPRHPGTELKQALVGGVKERLKLK